MLRIFPIKNNRIVFRSFAGKSYNCSPKYISEFLQTDKRFNIIWAVDDPKKYSEHVSENVKFIKHFSFMHFYYLMTAKIIVDNIAVPIVFPSRKDQVILNTWHGGGAYKKAGIESVWNVKAWLFKINSSNLFISSNKRFSEDFLIKGNFYKGEIIPCGLPRNDLFFSKNEEINQKVRRDLQIRNKKKLVLYAPTYRETRRALLYDLDVPNLLNSLNKRFGFDFVFGYRLHHLVENQFDYGEDDDYVVNAGYYEDMQELLYTADILITDYSSSIWDYSFTRKPCFIYATDLKEYIEERDFYTPIIDWPFPLAKNNKELSENILNFDEQKYLEKIKFHHYDLGSFESGNAREIIAERMKSICFG